MKIAAQLYTVRAFTQTKDDFADAVKKVAAIGYSGVQLSAHGADIPAEFIAEACKASGLAICSTHTPPPQILNETDKVIAEHKLFGTDQIGIGMMPEEYRADLAGVKKFISDFLPAALKIKEAGMRFAYHNHEFEFGKFDGKMVIDYLMEGFQSADMQIILDTFWVQAAGCDPVIWIKKVSGKVPKIHYKDYTVHGRDRRFAEIGAGNLNWPAIIDASKSAGVEWVIVEQDDSYGRDPYDSLKESYNFLRKGIK